MEIFLTVVFGIIAWVIYHQIFSVAYFDLKKGCLTEIIGCLAVGYLLSQLVMKSWIVIILIIIVGIVCLAKRK